MKNKFIIRSDKNEKWISLDFCTGSDIIYCEKFDSAYRFKDVIECINFLKSRSLDIKFHEIFALELIASPVYLPCV